MTRGEHRQPWRTGAALLFVYLLCIQNLLSPLASLRMEAAAAWFGVTCMSPSGDDSGGSGQRGSHCDASCLLRTQAASAPPVATPTGGFAPQASFVAFVGAAETAEAVSHGRRPQAQRAPPLV